MAAVYGAIYSYLSLMKSRYYLYEDFDYAIFAQATHGILHGTLFSSIRGMNWLGDHSSLLLFSIAPLYAAAQHPATLLILQSVVLGLGAVPVFWLARAQLGDSAAGIACAAVYLLHPALAFSNLYEFHPEVLSTTFLLYTFFFLSEGQLGRMVIFATLALLGREDVALVVGGMGIYALFVCGPARRGHGLTLLALAAASLLVSFALLKPLFNSGEADFGLLYSRWGGTPGALLTTAFAHPLDVLKALVMTPGDPVDTGLKQSYYWQLLLPVAFLSLLSPSTIWIAIPIVLEQMLADGHEHHSIAYHYASLVTPIVIVSAVLGVRNLQARFHHASIKFALVVSLLACLIANLWFGPFAPRERAPDAPGERTWPTVQDRTLRPYRDRMVARVPSNGGVVASFVFLDRFANRDNVQSAHHVLCGHYTISNRPYPMPTGIDAMIADFDPTSTLTSVDQKTGQRLRDLLASNRLRVSDAVGSLILCDRSGVDVADSLELWSTRDSFALAAPRSVRYDDKLELMGSEIVGAVVSAAEAFPVRIYWRRVAAVERVYLVSFVLLDDHDRVASQSGAFLGSLVNPVQLWPEDTCVRTTDRVVVPLDIKPGSYTLAVRVGSWDGRLLELAHCDDPDLAADRGLYKLGPIRISAGPVKMN